MMEFKNLPVVLSTKRHPQIANVNNIALRSRNNPLTNPLTTLIAKLRRKTDSERYLFR